MTTGEKIQQYRKGLGLSQEELGQKLLVSRQTISLWEKDQTMPTIDNLMRLGEIFGISVDEMLDRTGEAAESADDPKEYYQFRLSEQDVKEIQHANASLAYQRLAITIIGSAALTVGSLYISGAKIVTGFAIALLLVNLIALIRTIRAYRNAYRGSVPRMTATVYHYRFYDGCMIIDLEREGEIVEMSKYRYDEIELISCYGKWLFLQLRGRIYCIDRDRLKENAALFSYMYQNPAKVKELRRQPKPRKH